MRIKRIMTALVLALALALSGTASVQAVDYPLTVTVEGTGAGRVTSLPAGIDCTGSELTCSYSFAEATNVTLTAAASSISTFAGWTPIGLNCPGTGACQVAMSGAVNVTATFLPDTTPPTIGIGTPSTAITKTGPVTYTVTYADEHFNASTLAFGDIHLISSGGANGDVSVDVGTGAVRTVTIDNITGNGTLGISIDPGTASDVAGNLVSLSTTSSTFTVDNAVPTFGVSAPSASLTRSGPITYTVTYSDSNFNTSAPLATHISLNKTDTANGTLTADSGTGASRTVTISSISGTGTLGFSITAGSASDTAGNLAPESGPSQTFAVDNSGPSVTITSLSTGSITNVTPIPVTVTFSEPVTGFIKGDITVSPHGNIDNFTALPDGSTYTFDLSISGENTVTVDIDADVAFDTLGNGNSAAATFSRTRDITPPSIAISAPSATITKSGPVTYTVTYSDAHFDTSTLAEGDITLNKTIGVNGTIGVDSGTGTTRIVTISSTTGDGTLGISIAAETARDLAGNLANAAGPSTLFTVDNTPPTIDISDPSVPLTKAGPVTYTVTYADAHFNASTLAVGNVTLHPTGDATGTISNVSGTGTTRTVTISSISGNGTLAISIDAGTASDTVGNTAPAAGPGTAFLVDNTAFGVTIDQAVGQADPTKNSPIHFTVVFSKPVVDFIPADVALSGTAGPAAAVISGSGTTYDVAVSGMTANGTVIASIIAGTVHDAIGNANAASTFTDNTVNYDTIAPVFSSVTPANNAFINSITSASDISYTLSEALSAGSITMTRTGGTADSNSPHTCTLVGTALNPGPHTAFDMSNAINGCSTAQTLVSGTVYTFAFSGSDLAGNSMAVPLSRTGVTFDTTPPAFSGLTPANNAFINNITTASDVGYTLSETLSSGSITMTRTGGAGDGTSHVCTLVGTALSVGPHSSFNMSNTTNGCSAAQSLVSGTVYTFAFSGTDLAGNSMAVPLNRTGVTFDNTPPTNINWISPTLDSNRVYTMGNALVPLEVTANDNVGVTQVTFLRWDSVQWVEISRVYTSPFRITFDATLLTTLGWNEVNYYVYDAAGNRSDWNIPAHIWINRQPALKVTANGNGSVTAPGSINCGSVCAWGYVSGTVVTLTATPSGSAMFLGWTGACTGASPTCQVTLGSDKAVTATFTYANKLYLPFIKR